MEGTAPMPVCRVAPSGTKARTCSAMARSGVGGRRVLGDDRGLAALDAHVDLVEVHRVHVVAHAVGAREGRADLHHKQALGVGRGLADLADAGAGMERQAHAAVGVGRGGRRGHDARRVGFEDGCEATEVGRCEPDVGAAVAQESFERSEVPAEVVHVGVGEEIGEHREEGATDAEVLPVAPAPECLQEGGRLAGAEGHGEAVLGEQEGGRLVRREVLGHRPANRGARSATRSTTSTAQAANTSASPPPGSTTSSQSPRCTSASPREATRSARGAA